MLSIERTDFVNDKKVLYHEYESEIRSGTNKAVRSVAAICAIGSGTTGSGSAF